MWRYVGWQAAELAWWQRLHEDLHATTQVLAELASGPHVATQVLAWLAGLAAGPSLLYSLAPVTYTSTV